MDAGVHTVTDLLAAPGRLIIPVYQRPYVWTREDQWEPLWNDIRWLLDGALEGKSRRHFLGAIVLQQLKHQPGQLTTREVIDGQQRMTTLQILLAACAASAGEMGATGAQNVLSDFVRNSEDLATGDDLYKLWPTENDRHAFKLIMTPGGPPEDAEDDPSNSIQEAFSYFADEAKEFSIEGGTDSEAIVGRFAVLRDVLMQQLQVVSINLQEGDDAQVIFETLNARGTPLLEMDNVKNALFHRAGQQKADVQELNDDVWQQHLGQTYWREETRQGRLVRPRAELFLNHWLTMLSQDTVSSTKLFQAFRTRVLDEEPGQDAAALTRDLCKDAEIMRSFDAPDGQSQAGRYFRALDGVDTTTTLPLTLLLYRFEDLEIDRRNRALNALESFLVRRMLMGYTTKNYNRFFVEILKPVAADPGAADDRIIAALCASGATTSVWPDDEQLRAHLVRHPLYNYVARSRIEYVLWELELVLRDSVKTEDAPAEKPKGLSIEHVLPQTWEKNWPLPDSSEDNLEARLGLINVLGNLTLVTHELNSSLSNAPWPKKKERLAKSILQLNADIKTVPDWSEATIIERGERLADQIMKRWPGPEQMMPGFDPANRGVVVTEIDASRATVEPEDLELIAADCTELMEDLLHDLASNQGAQRTYVDIEGSLGWSKGRLASVFGGFSSFQAAKIDGRRPFHIGNDESGDYRMWMDSEQANQIKAALASSQL